MAFGWCSLLSLELLSLLSLVWLLLLSLAWLLRVVVLPYHKWRGY
jgi:hypothetical protein